MQLNNLTNYLFAMYSFRWDRQHDFQFIIFVILTEKHFTDHKLHMYKQEQTVKSMDHSEYSKNLPRKIKMQGSTLTSITNAEKHIILIDVT